MPIFDLHNDTLTKAYNNNLDIFSSNKLQCSFEKVVKSKPFAVCYSIFINDNIKKPFEYFNKLCKFYNDNLPNVFNDYNKSKKLSYSLINSILTVENGRLLQGKIHRLKILKNRGVKMLGLVWNNENEIGFPCKNTSCGLKPFGFEVVGEMNNLGIIIDVSHLSKKGVIDVVKNSKKPIIASHSNAKRICNNIRNLDTSSIKLIADNGGVIGVNMYPKFLASKASEDGFLMVKNHIDYLVKVGGIDVVGIGSDFDGIETTPKNISSITDLCKIGEKLVEYGYNYLNVEKILYKNAMRVFCENCGNFYSI